MKITVVMKTVLVNEEKVEFTRKIFWGKFFVVAAITSQNGTFFFFFFAKDEPILTHHNHSKIIVYLNVYSWCYTFY